VSQRRPLIARALVHPRTAVAVVVIGVPLLCWLWVGAMARDMYGTMLGPSAWMMRATWDAPYLLLLWAMWAAMMAAMMLPSATPVILLAARAVGRPDVATPGASARLYALTAGYLLVWITFSAGATLLQFALARSGLLTIMMEPASRGLAASLLVVAGLYQLTPLKQACLRSCRSPLAVFGSSWGSSAAQALGAGVRHGAYCLGCCWALMLLLFAGGVMNLSVILALTAWVAIEKVAPFGAYTSRVAGAGLLAAAAWIWIWLR
jgi:predicted metal-binding membrane protein